MTRAMVILVALAGCGGRPAPGAVTERGRHELERVCAGWGAHVDVRSRDGMIEGECTAHGAELRLRYRASDFQLRELDLVHLPSADLEALQARLVDDVLDAGQREAFRTMRAFVETGATPGNATTAPNPPEGDDYVLHEGEHARSLRWQERGWMIAADRPREGDVYGIEITQQLR